MMGLCIMALSSTLTKKVRQGCAERSKAMSLLTVYSENRPERAETFREHGAIAEKLAAIGVQFERWTADRELASEEDQESILDAYSEPVERLKKQYGFQSADVISVRPDHPQKDELRAKFLNEHVHSDFEVRFFVEGRGLFFLHPDENVYAVLCEQGDLISVPARVKHWFDMGASPNLKCIRLFTTPEGWVAEFTGSDIAASYPRLERFLKEYA
jgi:1,2-dihydroxy-3-keto-5-methylthiopentene dioxygenase